MYIRWQHACNMKCKHVSKAYLVQSTTMETFGLSPFGFVFTIHGSLFGFQSSMSRPTSAESQQNPRERQTLAQEEWRRPRTWIYMQTSQVILSGALSLELQPGRKAENTKYCYWKRIAENLGVKQTWLSKTILLPRTQSNSSAELQCVSQRPSRSAKW